MYQPSAVQGETESIRVFSKVEQATEMDFQKSKSSENPLFQLPSELFEPGPTADTSNIQELSEINPQNPFYAEIIENNQK